MSAAAVEADTALPLTANVLVSEVNSFAAVTGQLQAIEDRVSAIDQANAADHERMREDVNAAFRRLRQDVDEAITRSRDRYLPARVAGFIVAMIGSVFLAAANLLS